MTTLADAVGLVQVTEEDRTGSTRSKFKHWNSGDDAGDGCNTRAEVLIAEAVVAPTVEAGCKLTGGTWVSYYDGQEATSSGSLDIDHMVPLAESWDSWLCPLQVTAFVGCLTTSCTVSGEKSISDRRSWLRGGEREANSDHQYPEDHGLVGRCDR